MAGRWCSSLHVHTWPLLMQGLPLSVSCPPRKCASSGQSTAAAMASVYHRLPGQGLSRAQAPAAGSLRLIACTGPSCLLAVHAPQRMACNQAVQREALETCCARPWLPVPIIWVLSRLSSALQRCLPTCPEECRQGLMVAQAGRAHEQGEALGAPCGVLVWHELTLHAGCARCAIHRRAGARVWHLMSAWKLILATWLISRHAEACV